MLTNTISIDKAILGILRRVYVAYVADVYKVQ